MNTLEELHINTAQGYWARLCGLLGKSSLASNQALLIPNCHAVHTWGMRFAIDIVWLDQAGRVVGIHEGLRPWKTCHGPRETVSCLELAADTARHLNLAPGQKIV